MDMSERIQSRMTELGLRQRDIVNASGASRGTVSMWLSGGAKPTGERLVALAKLLQCPVEWLISGKGKAPLFGSDVEVVDVKVTKLPVLSLVQAGSWTGVESIQGHEIAEYENALGEHKDGHYYLRVTGMSNYPFYLEGDLVEINPLVEFDRVQTGQMVIMRCHGEATFKMLVREGSKTYLRALNKDFTPQFIEIDCDCTFVGVMEGLYRKPMRHHMQI